MTLLHEKRAARPVKVKGAVFLALVLVPLTALVFWLANDRSNGLSDGYYGCHTNNTGARSFWVARVTDGKLVAMEPDQGSPKATTFSMEPQHVAGEFNVTVNGDMTATCESED